MGRFPLTTDTDFQRNKNFARYREHGLRFLLTLQAKAVSCLLSLCERRITPAYFSLFPHYFSRKVVHFPAKVVLFFHPLLAPLSFPPGLPNEMGHFPTLSHSFQPPAQALFPFDHTYRRERMTFLALSICCTKQNSSNSSEDELLLFEIRNI